MLEVTEAVSAGRGVLYLYGNYGGDVMNFDLAAELAGASRDRGPDGPRRRRRRLGAAGSGRPPARDRRDLLPLQGRRARPPSAARRSTRSSPSPSARPTGCGRWASPSRRARSRRPASRRSSCPTARWRSGWASTASPASGAAPLEPADRIADELVDAILADRDVPRRDRGRGPRQRPRRDAEGGALHPLPAGRASGSPSDGLTRPPGLGRRVRDVARDGRRVGQRLAVDDELAALARRTGRDAVRRPGGVSGAGVDRRRRSLAGRGGSRRRTRRAQPPRRRRRRRRPRADGQPRRRGARRAGADARRAGCRRRPLKAIGMALARRAPSTGGTLIAFACLAAAQGRPPRRTRRRPRRRRRPASTAARDEVARAGQGRARRPDDARRAGTGRRRRSGAAVEARRSAARALPAAAAAAADAGATATIEMDATTGRAGWLADRARGHEDAGARLVAMVFARRGGAAGAAVDGLTPARAAARRPAVSSASALRDGSRASSYARLPTFSGASVPSDSARTSASSPARGRSRAAGS